MKNRKVPHQDHMNTVCLDRFFTRKNVALYRALADKRTGAARRREIFQLLAEEQVLGFRETCASRKSALTSCHGENADECVGTRYA